jgi:hypothetical protein
MSDYFGAFEVLEAGVDSAAVRNYAAQKETDKAIHVARRDFGVYLQAAKSADDWNDRLSYVISDLADSRPEVLGW